MQKTVIDILLRIFKKIVRFIEIIVFIIILIIIKNKILLIITDKIIYIPLTFY
jgi:hypothetical protein